MSTTTQPIPKAAGEIEVFQQITHVTHMVLRLTVDGLTQEDSLIQPQPTGNCLNWVVGHLLCVYDQMLPLLGQAPVMQPGVLQRYERGSAPIKSASEAMDLSYLLIGIEEAVARVNAGLPGLTEETLDSPAPFSPTGNPNETVRSLLTLTAFHQAYHVGQAGLLRRLAGKKGAIA
jgi:hypothetical protein